MDTVQEQLHSLNQKVDALYRIVEQLSHQLAEVVDHYHPQIIQEDHLPSPLVHPLSDVPGNLVELTLTHKDILSDNEGWESYQDYSSSEHELSPEIQIRRLTAQVTAAYNRIAALEEQLLARRYHPEPSR